MQDVSLDTFAQIGQQSLQPSTSLIEPCPPVLENIELPLSAYSTKNEFAEISVLSTVEDFQQALAALRKTTAPFVKRVAPSVKSCRDKQMLTGAQWRQATAKDRSDWSGTLDGEGQWDQVKLPHYGGPIGRATTIYQSELIISKKMHAQESLFLCFRGADYRARVFLNHSFVGEHIGFFEPFEFNVTGIAKVGKNIVTVWLENDAISHGNNSWGQQVDGDKLYAATGLGWDEPGLGWHHCPPGMGIYQDVYLESRPDIHIHDLWIRPLPEQNAAEVRVTVQNNTAAPAPLKLSIDICGWNFTKKVLAKHSPSQLSDPGPGCNDYCIRIPMTDFRWWTPDHPWLYEAQISLVNKTNAVRDTSTSTFGMRSFRIDEEGAEKGRLFLNGEEIRLRGANTMGHEQQCVFHGDWAQLHDDILIAKLAGLNFLRLTQRPVQREIYEACDALGIMVQTDLPLFAKLRRPLFVEAVRQAGAMERLTRGHACCIMASLINEPFPIAWGDTTHRHLRRSELESFFRTCAEVILFENPDRQLKPVDGDYDPPGPGLPDNHCYCGWYSGHGIDMGKLHRGHWLAVKSAWRYACGEFGAEGLDPVDLMQRRYPREWLPGNDEADWTPARILHAQTGTMYQLWMDRPESLKEWVEASQEHQARIIRLMTRAFRRDSRMVSFAVHLLIDAFPAGWMKSIVDCERKPKPAYFEYRDALSPLLVDLRFDRWAWYGDEEFSTEVWICNDLHIQPKGAKLRYIIEINKQPIASGISVATIPECSSKFQGRISLKLPKVADRSKARVRLALVDAKGRVLSQTTEEFDVFPVPNEQKIQPSILLASDPDGLNQKWLDAMGLKFQSSVGKARSQIILAHGDQGIQRALPAVNSGTTLIVMELTPGKYDFRGNSVVVEAAGFSPRHFVSRKTHHPLVYGFEKNDFRFWFDSSADCASPLMDNLFYGDDKWIPILTTGQCGWHIGHKDALACGELRLGKGRIILCQIKLRNRTATNPTAALFARRLLSYPFNLT